MLEELHQFCHFKTIHILDFKKFQFVIQAFVSYMFIFADIADNFVKFYFEGLVLAVGLNGLLNPILISHKIYASLLNYSTTFKVFS